MRPGGALPSVFVVSFLAWLVTAGDQHTAPNSDSSSSSSSSSRYRNATSTTQSQCEARTINYITHTLPQLCLTSSWTSASVSTAPAQQANAVTTSIEGSATPPAVSSPTTPAPEATTTVEEAKAATPSPDDAEETPFMSFEDWKEMMLRKVGQDPQEMKSRKGRDPSSEDRTPPEGGHASLGEEDEISLQFQDDYAYGEDYRQAGTATGTDGGGEGADAENALSYDEGGPSIHRSKDAGKTCKERFSYSSFDAGATVLKTGPSTKNAKAILVENKDSYMLLECAKSKFVIVELSDDVLIDTIVLANFEFFSSMIRHFRVSVSDRYPVKLDKWKEVGVFEARNTRDLQPFLVENPQIWAKYLRIEFLTHYGNEYYCPVSLLRVHGSRMLDSWKDSEPGREDDESGAEAEEHHGDAQEEVINNVTQDETKGDEQGTATAAAGGSEEKSNVVDIEENRPTEPPSPTSAAQLFSFFPETCAAPLATSSVQQSSHKASENPSQDENRSNTSQSQSSGKREETPSEKPTSTAPQEPPVATTAAVSNTSTIPSPEKPVISEAEIRSRAAGNSTVKGSTAPPPASGAAVNNSTNPPSSRTHQSSSTSPRSRASGTGSAAASSPTVQQGFFNAVTKRLQQVESNLTLSLQYLEDQSRHIQEALQRAEQKQANRVAGFLDTLNQTVLHELRTIREQCDQIWQSTVIALDSQRENSERDIVALSTRLNLLADEVVFQKRMAIVQAILLLSCLFLVIFSRSVPIPYLAPFIDPQAAAAAASYASPTSSHPAGSNPALLHDAPFLYRQQPLRRPGQGPDAMDLAATTPPYSSRSLSGVTETGRLPHRRIQHDMNDDASLWSTTHPDHIHSQQLQDDAIIGAGGAGAGGSGGGQERLSPPLTPILSGLASPEATASASALDGDSSSIRAPFLHSRKPLPALPEHPSSPGEPTGEL